MQFGERQLEERLATVLHRLASLGDGLSSTEPRKQADRVITEIRKIKGELDRALLEAQEASASCRDWRSSAEQAQRRADLLFLQSPVPTLIIERSGTVVDANPAAVRAVNTSHRHLVGKPFQLYMAAERDAFLARLQSIAPGDAAARWRVTVRPRERSPIAVLLSAVLDSEDQLLVMLLPPDSGASDSLQDEDDEISAQPA
jgi:PAS domain-containing protein